MIRSFHCLSEFWIKTVKNIRPGFTLGLTLLAQLKSLTIYRSPTTISLLHGAMCSETVSCQYNRGRQTGWPAMPVLQEYFRNTQTLWRSTRHLSGCASSATQQPCCTDSFNELNCFIPCSPSPHLITSCSPLDPGTAEPLAQ